MQSFIWDRAVSEHASYLKTSKEPRDIWLRNAATIVEALPQDVLLRVAAEHLEQDARRAIRDETAAQEELVRDQLLRADEEKQKVVEEIAQEESQAEREERIEKLKRHPCAVNHNGYFSFSHDYRGENCSRCDIEAVCVPEDSERSFGTHTYQGQDTCRRCGILRSELRKRVEREKRWDDMMQDIQAAADRYALTKHIEWTQELLSSAFSDGAGQLVTYGRATTKQHRERIAMFTRNIVGNIESAYLHESAIKLIELTDSSCLEEALVVHA